jgi:hypothetical protein
MTKAVRQTKYVPELSFIDREYIKQVSAVLGKNFLKIDKTRLPLNMRNLDRIKTYYEDGLVSKTSIQFWSKGYSCDILHLNDGFACVHASRKTKYNFFSFSGVVEKTEAL